MIFKVSITDLTKAVNKWNADYSLGLRDFRATDDKAAWRVGNCLVKIAQLTPMQGEPLARFEHEDYNGKSPNAEAESARQILIELLEKHFVELPLGDYPRGESDRMIRQAFGKKHPERRKDWPAWEAERAALATKTAEQAEAEFFDSRAVSSAASDVPTVPTKTDGGKGDRPPKEDIIKRRARVKELAGKTAEEISECLDNEGHKACSVATVNRDLEALGMVTPKAKRKST